MTTPHLSLLSQGLSFLEQRPNNPFLLEACQRHILALAEQVNQGGPMPRIGEESLLVKLAGTSLSLMLSWAAQVGEKAWEPAPGNPYPLADLLEGPLYDMDEALSRMDSESLEQTLAGIRSLVEQGMRVAMPLRHQDVEASNEIEAEERFVLHHAQVQISRAGLRDHPWADAAWMARHIDKNQGGWVFSRSAMAQAVVSNPVFTPDKRVAFQKLHEDSTLLVRTWQWVWDLRGRRHSDQVLEWMQGHGMDVRKIREEEFLKKLKKTALDSDLTLDTRWTQILEHLEDPPKNQSGRLTGLPYGLYALHANGALLNAALMREPPGGLHAKGPRGHTVWDAVLTPGWPNDGKTTASWTAILRLMKKIPLPEEGLGLFESGGRGGLLWHSPAPKWIEQFSKQTLLTHPRLWWGTDERAEEGAGRLLASLTCRERGTKRVLHDSDSAGRLALLWQHFPDMFSPVLKDLLLAVREVIAQDPEQFTDLGRDLLTAPMPEPQGSDWWRLVNPSFEKNRGIYSGTDPSVLLSENKLEAMMLEAKMKTRLPSASPSKKVRF